MKILAIETSSDACSAALYVDGEVYEVYEVAPRRHTQLILPMVEQVLAHGAFVVNQMDAVAFGRGPGAFTGVRVATSVTQGIAFGADLPVVAVSSLAALAHYAYRDGGAEQSIVASDARLGEVYTGCYRYEQGQVLLLDKERVLKPEDMPEIDNGTWCAIGNGWQVFDQVLRSRVTATLTHVYDDVLPHAYDIACLAPFGEQVAAEMALPVYLRDDVTS